MTDREKERINKIGQCRVTELIRKIMAEIMPDSHCLVVSATIGEVMETQMAITEDESC